jgi:GNAT superfamily N-acetyltransferase
MSSKQAPQLALSLKRIAMKTTTLKTAAVEIRRTDILSPTAQAFILALNAETTDRYPEDGANFFNLAPEEVVEGRGGFFVAFLDSEPVGCGAVRQLEPGVGEIKRMYVSPAARGRGIGGMILSTLEDEARRLGARRLVLETGPRQPEAIACYERAGFIRIPLFGEYLLTPHPDLSVCMAKDL